MLFMAYLRTALNFRMTEEQRIRKDVEGKSHGLI
jgi:hypothetical protein